jgi:hypothetical protein
MVTAVNAVAPANTIVATDGTTHLILTAEVPGTEWDVVVHATTMGATAPTAAVTYPTGPSPSTSLGRALAGVSQRPLDEEVTTIGGTEPAWPGNAGVRFWTEASVWVESAETPTAGATAYVELAAGASAGKFYAAASATRVALARSAARWERDGNVAADNLAVLRLNVA